MSTEISKQNIIDISLFELRFNNKRDVLLFFCNLIVPIYTIVMMFVYMYYFINDKCDFDIADDTKCSVNTINHRQRCIYYILIGCIMISVRFLINSNLVINLVSILLTIACDLIVISDEGILVLKDHIDIIKMI